MPPPDKTSLRTRLRQARRALGATRRRELGLAAADLVAALPHWNNARRLALYLPADSEFDPGAIAERARTEGKALFLPLIQVDNSLLFGPWEPGASLQPNRYGIPEPNVAGVGAASLDMVFLPLVGWDRRGTRLGMGGGYYDRSLQGVQGPLKVGLGFAVQEWPSLPRDEWDVTLDYVITGEAKIRTG